jgi:hypothetical protein
MKVPTELLREAIREELLRAGVAESQIEEILGRAFPQKPLPSRKRAKLVRSETLDSATLDQFRREQIVRMAEREFNRSDGNFAIDVRFIGGTRTLAVVRSGDEVTVWDLRKTVVRRRPSTKKMIAQRLPSVRVRSYEVQRVVVSRPEGAMVLTFPSRSSGVRLTPDILKERSAKVYLRWRSDGRWFEVEVPSDEWKQLVATVPCFRRKRKKMQISADRNRWFGVNELLLRR